MKDLLTLFVRYIWHFLNLCIWISGMILAKGFWSTFFAFIIIPFGIPYYGYFLVLEQIFKMIGWI